MGTDIHLHVEVKIAEQWRHYALLRPDRNYDVFNKMCGEVRANDRREDPIVPEARGLPDDMSYLTALVTTVDEGHSHSWLGVDEIKRLTRWYEDEYAPSVGWGIHPHFEWYLGTYLFGNTFYDVGPGTDPTKRFGVTDVRFVFYFDN